jgi:hypothetical protein
VDHQGRRFFEAGFRVLGRVFHLQASSGLGFDVTRFRQHNLNKLERTLDRNFKLCITGRGKSQTWVCTRRRA